VVSPDVWPKGLHPLVDRVRELGMQFGLWFEPEMVNADSDVARAHPEWIMAARGAWPVESRHQQVINLGIPDCYDHVLGQILAILDEYDIGYLKWDHNRDLIEAGDQTRDGRPGVHAQTLALYRMLAEIKARHPSLEIESCSSGGARVDLGILEHTDRVWVSDNIDPHDRQSMLRWTAQLIPPELMGSHIASGRSHTTGRTHDLNFRAATAIFGHLGIEWDLSQAGEAELQELAAWVAAYKQLRPLLLTGDLVRLDATGPTAYLHGVVSRDRSEAVFALATRDSALADPLGRLRFRGLDQSVTYHVTPALVGVEPSGLEPPAWWRGHPVTDEVAGHAPTAATAARTFPGSVFSGASLTYAGVRPPRLHPDQVVLFRLTATERPER
jgi:alpha-galactosidase